MHVLPATFTKKNRHLAKTVADPGISKPGETVEFLEFGDCFDAPSHIPLGYVFEVSIKNKKHIVKIAC